jgi:hypothetical protein
MPPPKPPYIRKLEELPPLTVWEVDGAYIRQNLSEEFTNFGQHFAFRFIPKNEFWIDKEHAPGEERFFVDHLLTEYRLMAKGKGYDQAHLKAIQVESRERHKADLSKKGLDGKTTPDLINKIHKEKLSCYSNNKVTVWVINGELVRTKFFVDFTEGGHDFVYKFVPRGEVWLDDDLGQTQDREFVLLHELHERALMAKGYEYLKAHRSASRIEHLCRNNPPELPKCLKEAVKQNLDT